jgi:hypothetical protein
MAAPTVADRSSTKSAYRFHEGAAADQMACRGFRLSVIRGV